MFKSISSFSHLRSLILLLLLSSSDVELNPGPFYNFSFRIPTIQTIASQSITGIPTGRIEGLMSITSSAAAVNLQTPFGSCFTTSHESNQVCTIEFPFNFDNSQSTWTFTRIFASANGALNVNLSISTEVSSPIPDPLNVKVINSTIEPVPTIPIISNPIPVSLINPSVVPVQIENVDPIEVEFVVGEPLPVSVINPTVFPVQIDNTDPIEVTIPVTNPIPVTGTVSIANPIPSVASTLFNAFKK